MGLMKEESAFLTWAVQNGTGVLWDGEDSGRSRFGLNTMCSSGDILSPRLL